MHTPDVDPRLPEPQPAAPAPLCIDCKHHELAPHPVVSLESKHRCKHPALRNQVDGATDCCARARADKLKCGAEGRGFAPSHAAPRAQPDASLADFLKWWLGSPLPAPSAPDAPAHAKPGAGTPTPAARPDAPTGSVFLSEDPIPLTPESLASLLRRGYVVVLSRPIACGSAPLAPTPDASTDDQSGTAA